MNAARLSRLVGLLPGGGRSSLILSSPAHLYYLLEVWLEPQERFQALLVSAEGAPRLFLNELFSPAAPQGVEVIYHRDGSDPLAALVAALPGGQLGVDGTWPARFLIPLLERRPGLELWNASSLIDGLMMQKEAGEIDAIRRAANVADRVVEELSRQIRDGVSETGLARRVEELCVELGGQGASFAPIVAFGEHCGNPHHEPTGRVLAPGDAVLIDMGVRLERYCSDITRTFFWRQIPEGGEAVYRAVLEANRAGIRAVKPGVRLCDVDGAARTVIERAGYGAAFTHRTGHGIGVGVHEPPSVDALAQAPALPGMVFSVEPGIYLPGCFGVRVEDLVAVRDGGAEVLSGYPRRMRILP